MGIRDDELKRVKKYAEGLGIKVYFKPYVRGTGDAEWDLDDQSITLFVRSKNSKTDLILTFLHELGHHLDWIYSGKKISKQVDNACIKLCDGPMLGYRLDLTQKERDLILQIELDGIHYMEVIYQELNLKIPYWKVKLAQHIDAYNYRMLAEESRFSTKKEGIKERKEMTEYYKDKYGNKL